MHRPAGAFFKLLFLGIGVDRAAALGRPAAHASRRWSAEFYALIVWCTLGHMLLASAAELFTIFLSLQLTSLPLIVLIGYAKRDPKSGEAALKYLLLVLVSTAVLLYGMSAHLRRARHEHDLRDRRPSSPTPRRASTPVVALGLVLLLTGFAFKITAVAVPVLGPGRLRGRTDPGDRVPVGGLQVRRLRTRAAHHRHRAQGRRSTGTSSSASWRRSR